MKRMLWLCAGILAAGNAQAQPAPYGYPGYRYSMPPAIGEAPPYLKFMNAQCAALHDSIRTAPARGLESFTLSKMRRDYDRECREDEREAQQQYAREQQERRQRKGEEKQAQTRAVESAKLHDQQCQEAKRILKMKKARTDLSDGEKADLQRFEDNYKARCT